jgi:hypothetical protein
VFYPSSPLIGRGIFFAIIFRNDKYHSYDLLAKIFLKLAYGKDISYYEYEEAKCL